MLEEEPLQIPAEGASKGGEGEEKVTDVGGEGENNEEEETSTQ